MRILVVEDEPKMAEAGAKGRRRGGDAGAPPPPAPRGVPGAGRAVELSPREFAVLEYLMNHHEEVLTRTRLLEHVWDQNYDGPSNIVDVYVGYLRKKLEHPFERP